ncbi:hypothetical protein BMIN_0696 [Bifidobacterium minimum]|uniref:Uncharacterized protein n=1 Tax=Bifidobacterium minimum TaxID=1693 RepID=A0A087BPN4_9BIFI|nr:hypothetical protein BMIN_0696 [Bifidobacterium minimum]
MTFNDRIIPASAGQTYSWDPKASDNGDHPRECGANACQLTLSASRRGSSPRVRGKRTPPGRGTRQRGIIPASAGQTDWLLFPMAYSSDHPRECGANLPFAATAAQRFGSSPRVRGKHLRDAEQAAINRIIPASAGQTLIGLVYWSSARDHPRECGANSHTLQRKPPARRRIFFNLDSQIINAINTNIKPMQSYPLFSTHRTPHLRSLPLSSNAPKQLPPKHHSASMFTVQTAGIVRPCSIPPACHPNVVVSHCCWVVE